MNSRRMYLSLIVACAAGIAAPAAGKAADREVPAVLNDKTFAHWRDFIQPSAAELAGERIDWHPTLWTGLTRAQEQKKPLMLWIMNGHPCGLT